MSFALRPAKRRKSPMLIAMYGVSGSGKTASSLLLAAGLAGPKGCVGFLDAENGRGEMYADAPLITSALPNGYEYMEIEAPFSPARYSEAIDAMEKAGVNVGVIDSFSHEWEGFGGCQDIAENNKLRGMPNWAKAKMEHKKLVNRLLAADMDLIFCLRAREKARPVKGSNEFEQLGIQPITEKNFVFEATISLMLEERTHLAYPIKVPDPLRDAFPEKGSLVTKATGDRMREWAAGGTTTVKPEGDLFARAAAFAGQGTTAYAEFYETLARADKQRLYGSADHDINKEIAAKADKQREEPQDDPTEKLLA